MNVTETILDFNYDLFVLNQKEIIFLTIFTFYLFCHHHPHPPQTQPRPNSMIATLILTPPSEGRSAWISGKHTAPRCGSPTGSKQTGRGSKAWSGRSLPDPALYKRYLDVLCHSKVKRINNDSIHRAYHRFDLLFSGRRCKSIRTPMKRLSDRFFPKAITTLNASFLRHNNNATKHFTYNNLSWATHFISYIFINICTYYYFYFLVGLDSTLMWTCSMAYLYNGNESFLFYSI